MDGDIKYGVHGKARSFEKRSSTDTHNSSFGEESSEMIVIGKNYPIHRSRSVCQGNQVLECHSDTALNPLRDSTVHGDGRHAALSEYPSMSTISFASAISDVTTTDMIQKRLQEMENEVSGKDATIRYLRKQLNEDGDKNIEFYSVAVETDPILSTEDDYQIKLNDLLAKIKERDNAISELTRELEESVKERGKLIEENKNIVHETNLVNRQLQSMSELVHAKPWDSEIDPQEFEKLKHQLTALADNIKKKDETIAVLESNIEEMENDIKQKDKLIIEKTNQFVEYKDLNIQELTKLNTKISTLERQAENHEKMYNDKFLEAQRSMEDEIIRVTQKLEVQYQEDLKEAVDRIRASFKKLSEIPKSRFENILRLCESDKLDTMLSQQNWEDQRTVLEKRINALQEEKKMEIGRLKEGYESKVSSLQSRIEALNQQLKERKETLEAFETELKMYRSEKARERGKEASINFDELRQLHAAEIQSQKEKHKLEKDLLQNKVKKLSEEILSHANNEKIHLQELQSAKLMASTFRKKYEKLIAELEEKISSKKAPVHLAIINELDLENSLQQFKALILSLKKAEEIHDSKIRHLKKLDQDEIIVHQREMNLFKVKLEQIDRFQNSLLELDKDIKELIKSVEMKYANTVQSLSSYHFSEVKLKQLEMDSMEQKKMNEIYELRKKMKNLEDANELLKREMSSNKASYSKEMRLLKEKAEELTVELLRNEGMLAMKSEIEEALLERIKNLEDALVSKNNNSRENLEQSVAKCIATEALISAKEELMKEYENNLKESEGVILRSLNQVDDIENQCLKLEESFKKFENVTQIMYEMNNCENYLILKKKLGHLEIEMKDVCARCSNLEEERGLLAKTNSTLLGDKGELMRRCQDMKMEMDRFLEDYELIDEGINKIMKESMPAEAKLSFKNVLDKIDKIGLHLRKTMLEFKADSINIMHEKESLEEKERLLMEERDEMQFKNDILGENLKILRDRVDYLLYDLSSNKSVEESTHDIQILYSDRDDTIRSDSSCTFLTPRTESTGTLKYMLRCDALFRENHNLKKENDELKIELKELEMEKENELGRQEMRSLFREEMISKLENIQKEMSEIINEKNALIQNFACLEEERNILRNELEEVKNENNLMHLKIETEMQILSSGSDEGLYVESMEDKSKMNEMRNEMERLVNCVRTLSRDLDRVKKDNEKLLMESKQHLKSNQCLKHELEEAWSQRYEIEDQLSNLRRENVVLNLHRDQLEQTNKKISNLLTEGAPSVFSWISIHETVENIVDIVQALKASFIDVNTDKQRTGKNTPGILHRELESKTKLCQQLVSQKLMLEKELETLENLMKRSKMSQIERRKDSERFGNGSQNKQECGSVVKHFAEPKKGELKSFKGDEGEPYLATLHKLKKHFEVQVQLQEAQLTEALANEIEGLTREMQQAKSEREMEALQRKHAEEIKTINRKHEIEVENLRGILKEIQEMGNNSLLIHEIESKHGEEMEELRRYFEKKCAQLEKSFSEDVFSQQFRKISVSSVDGDSDDQKEDMLAKYKSYLEEEESDNEKKVKFLTLITEILNRHAEELNFLRTKHEKETTNIQKRHESELRELKEELRRAAESERETLIEKYESRLKEVAMEERRIMGLELEREFESKVKEEIKRLGDLLLAESKAQEKDCSILEDSCMEKLSELQTESALRKIEIEREMERRNEEKFRKELEEEKLRIAEHYRDLNEAALRRFNEEQENLIKSHSEIVRRLIQEHEERISELKRVHKQDLERFHCDEGVKLAMEFRNKEKRFEKELSSIKSTYEDELLELKKCCQDTLNEQVCLAKVDAFNNLQKQIQDYLNGDDEDSLPSKEVIQLGERFAGKYRREIEELKEKHQGEVTRIRMEYEDKIRRRYSAESLPRKSVDKMEMRTDDDKLLLLRERDALQEMVTSLRHLLSELIRHVGNCGEELNNITLVEYGKNEETMYKSLQLESSCMNDTDCSSFLSKKVNLSSDLSNVLSDLNDSRSLDTTQQMRFELDRCLKQLKSDASHLLALSNPSKKQDENLYRFLEKIEKEKVILMEKVADVEEMQRNLKMDISNTKGKLSELARSREVVSEGYGEEIISAHRQEILIRLKDKAKALMGQHCTESSDILNVLDEICKEGDRLQDEARREKHDLQQQVVAADKQLRATRKFLEEQAAEREVERDEYTNEIKRLTEALRHRERDKSLQDRMNEEMETLETQFKEVNERLAESEQTKSEAESKLKDAVEKIWNLREIIRDLEGQVATLEEKNADLLCGIEEMKSDNEERENGLRTELENFRAQARVEQAEYTKKLEEELNTLRQTVDKLSPETVSQMRVNLREIELALTKKTKDLEQLHASSANVSCSSPCSEDVSVCDRHDATGCPTPDEMQEIQRILLPVEEIERLHDKLSRHTRAEELTIKTVRDLKMQLKNNKKALDEIQIERDVLLERVDAFLQENSKLKVRLDEQRCNAGIIQRQLSADLEAQIKRLEFDIEKLNELCMQKDKQIRDMNGILEQTLKSLKVKETEAFNKSNEESEIVKNLKLELCVTRDEKKKLEETVEKMKETLHGTVTVPMLMETMLEEKNAEIDRLEKEVARLSKQRAASSLLKNSTDSADSSNKSLKRVKFTEPDSFVQVISPILPEDQSVMRCAYDSFADLKTSSQKLRKSQNWINTPESQSSIGALQLSPRGADSYLQWNNSHSLFMSSPKSGDFEALRQELTEKCEKIKLYESEKTNVDAEIDEIKVQLKSTMDAVEKDKTFYKKEFEKLLETESSLRSELENRRRENSEQLLEIDTLKRKLAEVNLNLETARADYLKSESDLATKDEEINALKNHTESLMITMETLKSNHLEEVDELQSKLKFEHNRVESVLGELKILEVKKIEIEQEFLSLKEDYNDKMNSQETTVANLKIEVEELNRKNRELTVNCEKLEEQMVVALTEADKLSKDLTDELEAVKNENIKLQNDYVSLKSDLDSCTVKVVDRSEGEAQTIIPTNDIYCQTDSRKIETNDEVNGFQANVDKLKVEMGAWEEKMDDGGLDREEALSYAALVRTLISCILENLDDHFYELQMYRKKVMECSVDDLTDKVQKELMLSAKLDSRLLSNFQTNKSYDSEDVEATLVEDGGGDASVSKKSNLANVTVKLCELETNLQEMEKRNKEIEGQIALLKGEKDAEKRRADGLQGLVKILEDSLAKEKAMLSEEKGRCEEDAKIMEVLRMNFEMFVDKVDELDKALTAERQHRMNLEKMLKSPGDSRASVSDLQCQLEVERHKYAIMKESAEKGKKKVQELQLQLEQAKLELGGEKDMLQLLSKDLALMQGQKTNLESQLSHAKELIRTHQTEINGLKRKLNLQDIDIKALSISSENAQKKEMEMSLMVEKVSKLEKELDFYRDKVQAMSEKSESISAPLLKKMKILDHCMEKHVQGSAEMGKAVQNLTQETEEMKTLLKKIEENGSLSNSSDDTIIADVELERSKWAAEKSRLELELEKTRCDYDVLKKIHTELVKDDEVLKFEIKKLKKEVEVLRKNATEEKKIGISEDRVLYLFKKYMRTESYRKALAHQKTYLMTMLRSYENEGDAYARFVHGGTSRRRELKRRQLRSRRKSFKMVALVIIAINRMKFIVAKWRNCRLIEFNALMTLAPSSNKENEPRTPLPNLRGGPIDPLLYQTQNFLRPPQPNILRTPPNRDVDSNQKSKRVSENQERFSYTHKGLPHPR